VSSSAREGGILVLPEMALHVKISCRTLRSSNISKEMQWIGTRIYPISFGDRLTLSAMDHFTSLPAAIKLIPRSALLFLPEHRWSGIEMNIQYKQDNPRQWSDPNFIRDMHIWTRTPSGSSVWRVHQRDPNFSEPSYLGSESTLLTTYTEALLQLTVDTDHWTAYQGLFEVRITIWTEVD
jgi:hypothetical protein